MKINIANPIRASCRFEEFRRKFSIRGKYKQKKKIKKTKVIEHLSTYLKINFELKYLFQ